MKRISSFRSAVAVIFSGVLLVGCGASGPSDEVLKERVEQALAGASDIPADQIEVEVREGVVTLTGSVVCEECGGRFTPARLGTVQQSLGAIVRAVPGVESVEFSFDVEPGEPGEAGGG